MSVVCHAGLLLSAEEDTLTLFPPLTVTETLVHEGFDILEPGVARTHAGRSAEAA